MKPKSPQERRTDDLAQEANELAQLLAHPGWKRFEEYAQDIQKMAFIAANKENGNPTDLARNFGRYGALLDVLAWPAQARVAALEALKAEQKGE